uniref:von Willebrand factor type A domain-containing protein n=1 Tax=Trepomonas sp. PC1 TaxID=1076344 RepID=A0A146KKY3_9EUKA|eukprot:JAP96434.1 von Willebrand factor type A domain-containing protein [Trepomonas sp. PC1]
MSKQSNMTVIAIDLGTTTTAVAIRFAGEDIIHTFSPITGKEESQKTPSDLHVFLDSPNEKITIDNSQLGNEITQKFENKAYHFHFQAYKMALYDTKIQGQDVDKIEFKNEINYPSLPVVQPICKTVHMELSAIYTIVVAHIRKAIDNWFKRQGKNLDVQNTVWVATVPAIAGPKQKEFMRKIFVEGMGTFNGQQIQDDHLFCVLEPEGAFLYALMTKLAQITDGETLNVVAIDVGGGTLDTTVAAFQNGSEPEIKKSNFGSCVGGADVDKAFMNDIREMTQFDTFAANLPQAKQQTIMSNILDQFQKQKHEFFGQDQNQVADKDFDIQIDDLLIDPVQQIPLIRTVLESDDWGGSDLDEDERDALLLDNGGSWSIVFKVPFAIQRFMEPISSLISQRIRQLVNEAKSDKYKIDMGIILGGFSFCKSLVSKVQNDFFNDFKIANFGNKSSLAIVMGATMFNRFNLKKSIPQYIGLEVLWPYSMISNENLQTIKTDMPELCCDICETTPVGLKYLFNKGREVETQDQYIIVEHQFQAPTKNTESIDFIMYYMPETLKSPPQNFAFTKKYKSEKVETIMGFSIKTTPEFRELEWKDQILTVQFKYEIQSNQVLCVTKWPNQTEWEHNADIRRFYPQPIEKRFKKCVMQKFHTIFAIDRSGSMGAPTLDKKKRLVQALPKDRVGDVIETGILEFLKIRKGQNMLDQDKYSAIFFDHEAQLKWNAQSVQNPEEVIKQYVQPRGGTDFGPAFTQAIQQAGILGKEYVPLLIFLSDGEGAWGGDPLLNNVQATFGQNQHYINFGDSDALNKLAKRFGLEAKAASDLDKLKTVVEQIATIPIYCNE